jgi:hypothetical protein
MVGCNLPGRLNVIMEYLQHGKYQSARSELKELIEFFE